jgi:glyoxylase-like metal-dependent hydrolase (beta-lactamase superfamily II)
MSNHTNDLQLLPNQGWDPCILVCRNGGLVDVFIIVTERYVVLVDTLINATTAERMVAFAQPYLVDNRQLLVVNTHADYDHAWGNQLFAGPRALHPAPIIARRLCAKRFHQQDDLPQRLREMQAQEPAIFDEVRLTPPTVLFDEQLWIDGGDLTLQLFATPGHTQDQLSLYIPEIQTLLAADAAELPYPIVNEGGMASLRQSLAKMAALQPTTAFYCHAPVTIGPQLLHDNIAYFDGLERCCRAAHARGIITLPEDDAELIQLLACPFELVTPTGEHWQNVDEAYRTRVHARRLRVMFAEIDKLTTAENAGY